MGNVARSAAARRGAAQRRIAAAGDRRWTVVLTAGAVAAGLLLARQITDLLSSADRTNPALRQGDFFNAGGSFVVLVLIGVLAYRRARGGAS